MAHVIFSRAFVDDAVQAIKSAYGKEAVNRVLMEPEAHRIVVQLKSGHNSPDLCLPSIIALLKQCMHLMACVTVEESEFYSGSEYSFVFTPCYNALKEQV